jgi:hypothetical protein
MHQQINLFQPVFRKQQKVFSASTLAQIAAAVLVLLIAIVGHVSWSRATGTLTAWRPNCPNSMHELSINWVYW